MARGRVSVAVDLLPFGVAANEGDAMVSPTTIPERNKRCASLMIFTLMLVVTVKWLLSLVSSSVLKRSRDAESVKQFQQGGKKEKFRESSGKRGKIAGLLPSRLSSFDLGPGVFE
jgi:hypothetical protein